MQRAAIAFVTLFLIGLCIFLAGPAFELRAFGRTGNIDAGALPQVVIISVATLAILAFCSDMLDSFRGRTAEASTAGGTTVLLVGGAVLLLLAGFLGLWPRVGFPVAAAVFMMLTSALIAPPEARSFRGYAIMIGVSFAFCVTVWLAFTHILGVPLR